MRCWAISLATATAKSIRSSAAIIGRKRCGYTNHDPGESYPLAVFMVGAYQEILGDLHNLYGDTHAVHIDLTEGGFKLQSVVKGDTVSEVLRYVQYEDRELIANLQEAVEQAIEDGHINNEQAGQTIAFYERALGNYTYLSKRSDRGR